MKSIREFRKGDVVTRVEPAKPYGGHGGMRDRSYIGDRMEFVGIANGCAYFKEEDRDLILISGEELCGLSLDVFDDGWDYWVDPKTLLADDAEYTKSDADVARIQAQIDIALDMEDYEKAEKLKKLLDEINSKFK